jgi:uncharacterized protein (TIGR02598 family)
MASKRLPFPKQRQNAGLGLVEIALSLAIVSFALISLIGLAALGLGSGKDAREDTVLASLAKNVFFNLKTLDYATLSTLGTTNFYFTADGLATNTANSYFECKVRVLTPAQTVLNRSRDVVLDFSWPYGASKTNGRTFSSSIAEH